MATPQESLQALIASTLQLQESSRQVNVSLASVQETLVALAAGQTNVVARFDTFNGLMQTACGSFTRQADALVEAARIAKEDLDSRQRRGEKGTKSPTSFDGADKGWLGWSFQLETYFQNRNPGAEKVMREARDMGDALIDQKWVDDKGAGTKDQSGTLYQLLVSLCVVDSEPMTIVKNSNKNNGFDAWRRLCRV